MDDAIIQKGLDFLKTSDPILGAAIEKYNYKITITPRSEYAEYVAAIIGQRVNLKSAQTSRRKLYKLTDGWDFDREDLEPHLDNLETLLGIDGKRAQAIRNYHNGLSKGVGEWTRAIVEMRRSPDILPPNDVALLKAVQTLYKLEKRPTQKELEHLAEKWSPYKSIACFYLWKHELETRSRVKKYA